MKMPPPAPRPLCDRRRQSPRPAPGIKYWNALWPRHSRPSPSSSPPGRTRPSEAVFAFGGAHRNTPSAWGARRWSAPHMPRWPGSTSRRSTPDPQSHCATAAYAVHHADLSDEQSRAEAGGPGSPTKISFRASTAPAMLSKDSCQTGALLDWHVVPVGRLPRVDAPTLNVPGQRKSSSRLLMSSPRGAHRVYPTKPRREGEHGWVTMMGSASAGNKG